MSVHMNGAYLPRLYLDLDGVMADFDGKFAAEFGGKAADRTDDDMWALINGHPSFFRDMNPYPGARSFFEAVSGFELAILTACPRTNYANVARQKREWVREHLGTHVTVLPVLGGYNKPLFMHAAGDILIDDWDKNIAAWNKAGGVGIHHIDFATSMSVFFEQIERVVMRLERAS